MAAEENLLATLRQELLPAMADSIEQISFEESLHGWAWKFKGTRSGVSCELEYIGFWLVSLSPGHITIEVLERDPMLRVFLEAFDVQPIYLVLSRIGRRHTGWWLRFADGATFGEHAFIDRFIERRSKYREDAYEVHAGATLPSVE